MMFGSVPLISRRQAIQAVGGGFGALGLASVLSPEAPASVEPSRATHHAPRAKRVIQLFMNGGPFGPDLLDPKRPSIAMPASGRTRSICAPRTAPAGSWRFLIVLLGRGEAACRSAN